MHSNQIRKMVKRKFNEKRRTQRKEHEEVVDSKLVTTYKRFQISFKNV
jgi:hypothetical protein